MTVLDFTPEVELLQVRLSRLEELMSGLEVRMAASIDSPRDFSSYERGYARISKNADELIRRINFATMPTPGSSPKPLHSTPSKKTVMTEIERRLRSICIRDLQKPGKTYRRSDLIRNLCNQVRREGFSADSILRKTNAILDALAHRGFITYTHKTQRSFRVVSEVPSAVIDELLDTED